MSGMLPRSQDQDQGTTPSTGSDANIDLIALGVVILLCAAQGILYFLILLMRRDTLNRSTENQHQPLLNHNTSDIHIQVECLNLNPHAESTPVPGELQEIDLDDQNGSVDLNPEFLEGQSESESGDELQPLLNRLGAAYIQMQGLSVSPTPVPDDLQEPDRDDHNGSVDSNPESREEQGEWESGAGDDLHRTYFRSVGADHHGQEQTENEEDIKFGNTQTF